MTSRSRTSTSCFSGLETHANYGNRQQPLGRRVVFAPHFPRTYDTVRPQWQAEKKLTVSLLLHAPFYLDTPEPGMYRPNLIPGGVGGAAPDSGAKQCMARS